MTWRRAGLLLPLAVLPILAADLRGAVAVQQSSSVPDAVKTDAAGPLSESDARRLFFDYIHDRKNVVRNCLFVGGGRVERITARDGLTTARIRYTLQCVTEEISTPPLNRTLVEDFLYRQADGLWTLLGRAYEVPPSLKGDGKAPAPSPEKPKEMSPLDRDRKALVEVIISWAGLNRRPAGIGESYPGASALGGSSPVLVSAENLGGISALEIPGRGALVLSPEALIQRAALAGKGAWIRFDTLDIGKDSARAEVSIVAPVLPAPAPGGKSTAALSRLAADFSREQNGWVLTRYRQHPAAEGP